MKRFALALSCAFASACGGTPTLHLSPAAELEAARALRDDGAPGDTWLHFRYQARVDASTRPGGATSEVRVVAALTRYDGDPTPVQMHLCVPATSATPALSGQVAEGAAVRPLDVSAARDTARGCPDPTLLAWTVSFAAPPSGAIAEVSAVFEIPGTLAGDVQPVAAPSGRLIEGLWRYDLPDHGVGQVALDGSDATAIATQQGGRNVHAVFARDVVAGSPGFLRFATRQVAPVGRVTDFSSDWAAATAAYVAGLADPSASLTDGYEPPYRPAGDPAAATADALAWTQARPLREGGFRARWSDARNLPTPLAQNDLTATDKVHLLAWVLREANLPFRFAMARPGRPYAPLDPAFPQAGAFTTPLLATTAPDGTPRLLDPACEACAVGEVRPGLRGGQAIVLPASSANDLVDLP
jgi:hypothetical protein